MAKEKPPRRTWGAFYCLQYQVVGQFDCRPLRRGQATNSVTSYFEISR